MPSPGGVSTTTAKSRFLDGLSAGLSNAEAMSLTGRTSLKTLENWRANDPAFRTRADEIRAARKSSKDRGVAEDVSTLDFASWRKRFLGQDTYPHQQAWIDLIEKKGYIPREGEDLDENDPNRIIINVPPYHAKSQTMTIEYATYRICMNPNIRIMIVSKRQDQAKTFLYSIKQRLTSNQYAELQAAYAPEGGFKPDRADGATWGMNAFYVRGIDSGAKDPTVQALGLGGQVYGTRSDLIILDDCIVGSNANEYEKQIFWLESELENRTRDGDIVIIGTRLAPKDMYSELRNGDRYLSGTSPWTYLRQPAVLKYADDPKDWRTLWPESSSPLDTGQKPKENGMYGAWDGPRMARERNKKPPRIWSLVYQQENVSEDAVFHPTVVMGSTNRMRKPGKLNAGAAGHPRNGMEGQYIIASMDPAMTGDTFSLVYAVDKNAPEGEVNRRILQCWLKTSPTPAYIREHIKFVTDEYNVNEWAIESNAFQLFLTFDEDINRFLQSRGVKMSPHYTSRNKQDPDFGVASMASLFGGFKEHANSVRSNMDHDKKNIIELPDPDKSEGTKALIEQLTVWQPGKLGKDLKQDGPMALWFAELRAREILGVGRRKRQYFMDNPYLSRGDRAKRAVVPTEAYRLMAIGG
jgi:hypothetical protein